MRARQIRQSHRNFYLVLVAIIVTSFGGAALACDHGVPIDPDVVSGAVSLHFGLPTGQMQDVACSVDTRETMEPQLTAMLTMGEMDAFPSRVVATTTQPAVDTWIANLKNSVTIVSRMAMDALTRCL